mmetsp:Transcript_8717/g.24570  ORF Transcript_8717/g.24570 Transcript_8717/m.24570 type:complete len:165 (-) Transcript_8717:53-547(-)
MPSSSEAKAFASEELGITEEVFYKRLNHLKKYAMMAYCTVLQGTLPAGVALLPFLAANGSLVTCRLIFGARRTHEGEMSCLTTLEDISQDMAVVDLMNMASTGDYFIYMRDEKAKVRTENFQQHLATLCDQAEASAVEPATLRPSVVRRVGHSSLTSGEEEAAR